MSDVFKPATDPQNVEALVARILARLHKPYREVWSKLDKETRALRLQQWNALDERTQSKLRKLIPAPFDHTKFDAGLAAWREELLADLRKAGLPEAIADTSDPESAYGAALALCPIEIFFEAVFGGGITEGLFRVSIANTMDMDSRDVANVIENIGTDEAEVSMQTVDGKGKPWEQTAVSFGIESVEAAPLPPSLLMRHTNGDLHALWFLDPTVNLRKTSVVEDLTEPSPLPTAGWSLVEVHADRAYKLTQVQQAFAPAQEEVKAPVAAPAPVDDGVVWHGTPTPEFMARKIDISFSPHGQQTPPGRWRRAKDITVKQLIGMLKDHKPGVKDGNCIVAGPCIDGKRQANAIPHLDLLVIDIDVGQSIDAVIARLEELGLFAVIYSTHSHLKDRTEIKKDILVKYFDDEPDPDEEQVCEYLRTVKRYQPEILEGAELLPTEHTAEGIKMVLQHMPMPKFRVVMVLKDRFVIEERAAKQQDAIKEWRERYFGASQLIGAYCDRSCTDPSRLFFTPRHPKDAKEWRVEVVAGEALDIETCDRVTAEDLRKGSMDAFARAGEEDIGKSGKQYKTDQLSWFFGKYGAIFDVETFLLDMDPDGDRGPRSSGPGRTHRCPNDDAHSNAGDENDRGFFCVNGIDSETGGAVAYCSHDTCKGMGYDRANYVDMICERVGIKDAEGLMKWVPEVIEEVEATADPAEATPSKVEWPHGYKNQNGFFGLMAKGDGDEKATFQRICGALDLLGKTKNENGSGWSLLIAFKDDTGEAKEMAISLGKLLSDSKGVLETLADAGLSIVNSPKTKLKLLEALSLVKTNRIITDATKTGWYDKAYLPALGDVIGASKTTLRLAETARPDSARTAGTLPGWKDNVAEMYAVCDFHRSISLAGEFAGPLVGLLEVPPVMTALTGDSSCGKSLSMKIGAAASTDPSPKKGSFITAYGTAVGLEERIARGNHGCLYIDELRLMDPRAVDKLVMSYSSGTDKDRGKAQGGLRRTRSSTGAAVLSNEKGMRETIEGAGVDYVTGIGVRCVDVDVSGARTCDDKERVIRLEMNIGKHYGHALPVYIRYLQASDGYVDHPDRLVARIAERVSWLLGDGKHKAAEARAARVLATFMVGLEIALEAGVLPPVVTLETIEADYRAAWSASVGDAESNAVNDASKAPVYMQGRMMELWDVHGWDEEQEAQDTSDWRPRHLNRERLFHAAKAFSDRETSRRFIAVSPDGFAKLLPKGVKAGGVKKLLHKHGLIMKRSDQYSFYNLPDGYAPYSHYRLDADYFGPKAIEDLPRLLGGENRRRVAAGE